MMSKIRDNAVSRKHLKIFSVESCYFIEDLKTKNGTMINGEPLDAGFAQTNHRKRSYSARIDRHTPRWDWCE